MLMTTSFGVRSHKMQFRVVRVTVRLVIRMMMMRNEDERMYG